MAIKDFTYEQKRNDMKDKFKLNLSYRNSVNKVTNKFNNYQGIKTGKNPIKK